MIIVTKKPWFGPKRFGWGFAPITWEGWVSVAVLIAILFWVVEKHSTDPYLALYVIGVVAIFTLFCFMTGSKPGPKLWGKK